MVLGALLILAALFAPPLFGLEHSASKVALLALAMATLWISEAVPIPATALLPMVMLPMLGIAPINDAAAPYSSPIIYLFMGGFMLAIAMERWNLHKRIALGIISAVGTRPRALVMGFLCASAFLSMWTSNSATAMMLLPIGVSVYALLKASHHPTVVRELGAALALAIAYGANIGGMGTLIGTPPNALLKAFVESNHDIQISFAQWMMLGVPLVIISLPLVYLILTRISFKVSNQEWPGVKERIQSERAQLGRMSQPEWAVTGAFGLAIVLWISRELWKAPTPKDLPVSQWPLGALITDEVIAMGAAMLLFIVPVSLRKNLFVLDWQSLKKMPWEVLILFGGGLSLASAIEKSGLVTAMASGMQGMAGWNGFLIILLVTFVIVAATELTSNTATTAAMLPVISTLALAIDQPVLLLCVPLALGASAAFSLPVGTPPNAIVFGSGLISLPRMARAGVWVNLLFILLIPVLMWTLGRWVFGI